MISDDKIKTNRKHFQLKANAKELIVKACNTLKC